MDCELHTDRVLLDDVSAPYKWSNNNNTNNNKYGAFVGTCIYRHHESLPHCNPNINTEGRGEVFRGEVTSVAPLVVHCTMQLRQQTSVK